MARRFSRALFAVRPGFIPSCSTARSYTQSRKSRMFLPTKLFDGKTTSPFVPFSECREVRIPAPRRQISRTQVAPNHSLDSRWHRLTPAPPVHAPMPHPVDRRRVAAHLAVSMTSASWKGNGDAETYNATSRYLDYNLPVTAPPPEVVASGEISGGRRMKQTTKRRTGTACAYVGATQRRPKQRIAHLLRGQSSIATWPFVQPVDVTCRS